MLKYFLPLSSILVVFFAACSAKSEPEKAEKTAVNVEVQTFQSSLLAVPVQASGIITSDAEARLSFKTGGLISRMLVQEGQQVQKGQLLASLQLTEINAQVNQAQQGLDKAKRDFSRVEALRRDSAVTLEQFQNAKTALSVAEETVQIARFNQQYSSIVSPVSGKVIRKLMNEGELAGPGMPVYFIQSNAQADWVVKLGVADVDWTRLQVGDSASVFADAFPGEVIPAIVDELGFAADPMTGTFPVKLRLVAGDRSLASGMVAKMTIHPHAKEAHLVLPMQCLSEAQEDRASVFVLSKDKKTVSRVEVKILQILPEGVVVTGVPENSSIVTKGAAYLHDQSQVIVTSASAKN